MIDASPMTNATASFEKRYCAALDFVVLPGTAAELLVCTGADQVRRVGHAGLEEQDLHVFDARRSDSELPWLLTSRRLHVRAGEGEHALAFDMPHKLLSFASSYEPVVRGAASLRCQDGAYFFLNGLSTCWIYRYEHSDLVPIAELPGHVYTAFQMGESAFVAGVRLSLGTEGTVGQPMLWNINTGAEFGHQELDATLRVFAQRSAAHQLPAKYMVERLHADAFIASRSEADGSVTLLAGVAEYTMPSDLSWDGSDRSPVPGYTDYVGLARFRLDQGRLDLVQVDFEHLYLESVQRGSQRDFYLARKERNASPTLSALCRQQPASPNTPSLLEPLHFTGIDVDTRVNSFKVSHRHDIGFLALANIRWGFEGARFSPDDLLFSSQDGLTWKHVGSTSDLAAA